MILFVRKEQDIEEESKRSCNTCYHCQLIRSSWCMSYEAREKNKRLTPIASNCEFWEPGLMLKDISLWTRLMTKLFGKYSGYIIVERYHDTYNPLN